MNDRRQYVMQLGYGDGIRRWIERIDPGASPIGECVLTEKRDYAKRFGPTEAFLLINMWRAMDRVGSIRAELDA